MIISETAVSEFQLKLCKGISYAAVAAHVDSIGRWKLAAMLVDYEPHSSKQVFFNSFSPFLFLWPHEELMLTHSHPRP